MNNTPLLLPGEFDLHIIDTCNLSCSGCVVLDYKFTGLVTNERLSTNDVEKLLEHLTTIGVRLETLKILGGEPTLHSEFEDIVNIIVESNICDKLVVITNGLNFSGKIINVLKKVDKVAISIYPDTHELYEALESSLVLNEIKESTEVEIWFQNTFDVFGKGKPGVEYRSELNWNRCYQKTLCRVITPTELYRCTVSYSEKKESCKLSNAEILLDFVNNDVPLELCSNCPTPPAERPAVSNVKRRILERGIKLIVDNK